ncbi:MAG TPA: DUF1302 family protein [Nevskiaceae bacterium]|nr:DUF1302 family protein [Nevskiaceae bacterium]
MRPAGRSRGRAPGAAAGLALALAFVASPLQAEWETEWAHRFSLGAAWRTESRDPALIGKSNLDPQLCAADDCLATSADDTGPNARYLAAPGADSANTDAGDLAYEVGEIVAAPVKLTSRFRARRGAWSFEAGALAFYDAANVDKGQSHPNTRVEPGPQPGVAVSPARDDRTLRDLGYNLQLLETFAAYRFEWDELPFEFSLGRQRLVWGESSFVTQGSLNIINPPDVNNLVRPGTTFDEIYRPVGMAKLVGALSDSLEMEAFYQFEWRPAGLPALGSFLSFLNAGNEVTENETVVLPLGKAPRDPLQIGTPANEVLGLVSQTSYSARRAPNVEPDDLGQYGLALYYTPEARPDLELGLYYARYHARIPSLSAYASAASCTRREGNARGVDVSNGVQFVASCGLPGRYEADAAPLDTVRYFIEYPEGIQLFGASFSSLIGGLAVRGELAYRPDQPVQVDLEDVVFAALQPALPRQDIPLAGVPGLPGVLGTTVPGSRTAIPDFLTAWRGGVPGEVAPGATVRGYERLKVLQGSLALTRIYGNRRFLGSSDSALLFELTGIGVTDLPPLERLQLEGPGTHTHASPGIAETGNALNINPRQNRGGYVTGFSWGYRAGLLLNYRDLGIPDLAFRPLLVFTQDVEGVSPGFGENFLEGRKLGVIDLGLRWRRYELGLSQALLMGGGNRNVLRDRDFFSAALTITF